jgi:guanylate kinase
VINRDLDHAFADVEAILAAERLKRDRQTGLSTFVRGLQAGGGVKRVRSRARRGR